MRNLSFYKFTPLRALPSLRVEVKCLGAKLGLQGTVLLAEEGVNAMLTGEQESITAFRAEAERLFGQIAFKEMYAPAHSFSRLLVKLKKEIISVGDETVRPHLDPAPRLSPEELRLWLEEGREFYFLDTRNTYEVEVGTFRGATHLDLTRSRDFASLAEKEKAKWQQGKPLVTFCTGGIRCEKGAAVLRRLGVEAYQLDGGILHYFEKTGGAHFEGACFVYDWRLAVNGRLEPVPRSQDGRDFGRHKKKPT
jgi:UPF0176 protein